MKITLRWRGHRSRQVWVEGGDIRVIIRRNVTGAKRGPTYARVSVSVQCPRLPSGGTTYAGPKVLWAFRSARKDLVRLLVESYAGVA